MHLCIDHARQNMKPRAIDHCIGAAVVKRAQRLDTAIMYADIRAPLPVVIYNRSTL